ncbi:BamA/TamA family outer membrane protein [Hymenobacter sp. BT188]|uniref:translocation and assembly module lipoprotein TamL n=1 Tax=Hymenobacter sp. BT188 TaxID=2763504 RepID=UPI001651A619|nr:BamA/TamA family outer membrane protein [Hymenobacter sp. BT188]MBC6605860.1 BamA/TamA family outer membrane protein [Hymenobacter sp. BT188]
MKPYTPLLGPLGGFFKEKNRVVWLAVLLIGLLDCCTPTRLLPPGRNLLRTNKLKGVEQADALSLEALYQQEPNSRFPLPKLAIYQLGSTFYNREKVQKRLEDERLDYRKRIQAARPDSVKVGKLLVKRDQHLRRHQLALDKGNAVMRLGEAPVVYDSTLTQQTVEQLSIYLKSQGFFRSRVTATDTVHKRMVTVTYHITENTPFTYAKLEYIIPDSGVARVVRANQKASLLQLGQRYNETLIGQERARLETLLKNEGYYDFRQQYITLEADTSFAPNTVQLRTLIANPAPGTGHHVYSIRHVNFLTDAGAIRFGVKRDTILRDSVYYLAFRHRFSTRVLDRKLTVRPEQRYSLANTQLTQRQLADLDVFRFNNVNYIKVEPAIGADTTYQLDAVVNASPHKRFQELTEFGATYVAEQVGPFVNARLKVRNVFGGAEVLEFGVRAGFEGQYNRVTGSDIPETVLTTQLGGNINLVIPQFILPWRSGRILSRYNPRTRLNLTYTYVQRPEYTRTNLEGTFDYIWQRSLYHQWVLTPIDVSIINATNISPQFRERLDRLSSEGSPLFRSFTQLYVPSINATSLFNSNDFNQTRDATFLRLFAEVGGLTRTLYEDRINLNVYDFAKFTADYRRYHKLGPKTFFVYRFNGGIARALTRTDVEDADGNVTGSQLIIPYDKYLFAGGSSSVRAWKPRRLGPGAYTTNRLEDDGTIVRDYNLEQPGELLLEANVEYRFPVYSFINGAVFTDAGNVWTLQSDPRSNAQFKPDQFWKQFAVGSGVGIRLDFSFLILRLDVATKVYDPTAPDGEKWAIRNFKFLGKSEDQTAFNLGIGYPF